MNPIVDELIENDGVLTFRLSGVNVSIANGLRRVVHELSTVVLKSTPQNSQRISISINTTRFNNEIIKQRLGCIPVYADIDFPFSQYEINVDKQNIGEDIIYVTTGDFKVVDINTQIANEELTNNLFPINKLSGYYPELVRLLPNLINKGKGEHLKLKCKFSISSAIEDGMFNIASTCTYSNTIDSVQQNIAWTEKLQTLEYGNNKDVLEFLHTDWLLLDGKRIFKPNSFEFKVETVGPIPNNTIIVKACKLLIDKFGIFKNAIIDDIIIITESRTNIPNSYDFTLVNEDFTIGKVIELILYTKFYETRKLIFCGFRKPHPHINESIIRIAFEHKPDNTRLKEIMIHCADDAIALYSKMLESFTGSVIINTSLDSNKSIESAIQTKLEKDSKQTAADILLNKELPKITSIGLEVDRQAQDVQIKSIKTNEPTQSTQQTKTFKISKKPISTTVKL